MGTDDFFLFYGLEEQDFARKRKASLKIFFASSPHECVSNVYNLWAVITESSKLWGLFGRNV